MTEISDVTDPVADNESRSKTETEATEGVEIMTGDPRKALIKLSVPMIAAMILLSVYNVIDAVWVSGLGSDALAAVGFTMPLIIIVIGLGNGIGAGVNSLISRLIGAGEKARADNAAMHAFCITAAISILITVPLLLFLKPLLFALGADSTIDLAYRYAIILFTSIAFFLFLNIGYAVFRSEGDMKRPMYAMAASSILNIVLDPIFIYVFDWGIEGAAWASVVSVAAVSAVMVYWFRFGKSYLTFSWKCFKFDGKIVLDTLKVGIPASMEYLLIAIIVVIMNLLLVDVANEDAVAVYTTVWCVVMFAIVPLVAISTAAISIYGANFGATRYDNLKVTLLYGTGIGVALSIVIAVIVCVFAHEIAYLFTYADGSAHLAGDFAAFLRIMCILFPFAALGLMANSLFQGIGKGGTSLAISLFREVIFSAVFAYILAENMGFGQLGVWWGGLLGYIAGDSLGFVWAYLHIRRLLSRNGAHEEKPAVK
ncbi:MAG: MATE family efflux transporter [Methanomicrobium sp.]|nr:MATE family efflux transporter [Methanomicrobium sp.]